MRARTVHFKRPRLLRQLDVHGGRVGGGVDDPETLQVDYASVCCCPNTASKFIQC